MDKKRIAVYPGTYDPLTNGHIDIIERGLRLFDHITVAVLKNPHKNTLFSTEERLQILQATFKHQPRIKIDHFEGLLVDYLKRKGMRIVVRGLRAISDFEIELQMALLNRQIDNKIETIFLMPSIHYSFLSSRLVKEIYQLGGEVQEMVPAIVDRWLKEKYGRSISERG